MARMQPGIRGSTTPERAVLPDGRLPLPLPADRVREGIVRQVRALFNDEARGQAPVVPSDDALFAPDTPIRMVHADIVGMMVGGIRGLLLQMLHPHALQGVLDHSNFRADMHSRLRRTARFIAVTTYGARDEAEAAIARVNAIHRRITGTLPDGTPYSATNPRTLAWVHLAEADSFLTGYVRLVRPAMPHAERDEYYRQFATIARRLGADPVPETTREAELLLRDFRAELRAGPHTRTVANLVLGRAAEGPTAAVQTLLGRQAVSLLPPWARDMLGLDAPRLSALPTAFATRSLGQTLRWAFRRQ